MLATIIMATIQDSLETAVKAGSPRPHKDSNVPCAAQPQKRKNVHPSNTRRRSNDQENTPLLGNSQPSIRCFEKVKTKFKSRRCCLCSSRAAILILVWNAIVSFGLLSFFNPTWYNVFLTDTGTIVIGITYGISAFLYLFYPLAGCLADIRWGRHKTVVNSLCFIFWGSVLMVLLASLAIVGFIPFMVFEFNPLSAKQIITVVVLSIVFGTPLFFGVILFLSSLTAFSANVIQFGMDQLHDAPTDHSVLYVHWYVWTTFLGELMIRLPFSMSAKYIVELNMTFSAIILPFLAIVLLGVSLCIQKYKRTWFNFLIDSGSRNPYKLVFKVLKFAKEHSHPIRRSAFTYCEDKLPSRLDFGKEKYGGPFTTEEVENVKAFVGILCILLTLGPIFLVDVAVDGILPFLASNSFYNGTNYFHGLVTRNIYSSGVFTPLVVVITIPLYLGLLRPFIYDYIPGMLKRIGLGMIMFLLSGLCTLVMGLSGVHCYSSASDCDSIFDYSMHLNSLIAYFQLDPNLLLIQSFLNAFGYMFLYVASYEFICAQSPHSMKGLLIGTFFAIKGVFQLIGVLAIYVPLATCVSHHPFPLCGVIYYLINIVVALVGIVAFIIVSRRYQYRQRDEPDDIYRYAEEYYANTQDEPNYDYDDYDNLNCETIQ